MAAKCVDFGLKTGYDFGVNTYLILSWAFFLISVICALMITSVKSPLTRKYRKILISTAFSGMILGVATWSMPLILRQVNPIQSKKVPLEKLPITVWEEPIENPITSLENSDEMAWLKKMPEPGKTRFKYKLKLSQDIAKPIIIQDNVFIYLDPEGNLRGFDPYTGFNHWSIQTGIEAGKETIVQQVTSSKRLFLLDVQKSENIRISCIDLQSPSILWQRVIPESRDASAVFDFETQSLIVATGGNGIWSLKSKTGEILWKKPDIFSKTKVLHAGKSLIAFEPPVGKRTGSWYFLDPQTGAVTQKQSHVYPEMDRFIPFQTADGFKAIAQTNSHQYSLLNPADLGTTWSQNASEPVDSITIVDEQYFLVAAGTHILEKRNLNSGELIWQKKLNQVDLSRMEIDLRKNWMAAPIMEDGAGAAFYSLEDGNYLFTAELPEAATGIRFFGDWFYLITETMIWGFQN
jgi:hypothetical protein